MKTWIVTLSDYNDEINIILWRNIRTLNEWIPTIIKLYNQEHELIINNLVSDRFLNITQLIWDKQFYTHSDHNLIYSLKNTFTSNVKEFKPYIKNILVDRKKWQDWYYEDYWNTDLTDKLADDLVFKEDWNLSNLTFGNKETLLMGWYYIFNNLTKNKENK